MTVRVELGTASDEFSTWGSARNGPRGALPVLAGSHRTNALRALVAFGGLAEHPGGALPLLDAAVRNAELEGDDVWLGVVLAASARARLLVGDFADARSLFVRCLDLARWRKDLVAVGEALVGGGTSALRLGLGPAAAEELVAGLASARHSGRTDLIMDAQISLAEQTWLSGRLEEAHTLLRDAIALSRNDEAPYEHGRALTGLAFLILAKQPNVAKAAFRQVVRISVRGSNLYFLRAPALRGLGRVSLAQRDSLSAQAHFKEALDAARCCGDKAEVATILHDTAILAAHQGDHPKARSLHREGLALAGEISHMVAIADGLEALGHLPASPRSTARCICMLAAAQAIRDGLDFVRPESEVASQNRAIAAARVRLGDETFTREWGHGYGLTPAAAVRFATSARGPRLNRPEYGMGALTPAEYRVARRVGEGLSNKRIATDLSIAVSTVKLHVHRAKTKLGLDSRLQLALALRNYESP